MKKKCCEKENAMKMNSLQKIAMKKDYVVILFFLFVFGLYSCTDGDPIEKEFETTKSVSLRYALNQIKKDNGIDGRNALATSCFNFVYPLRLTYNNGTDVTVSSFDGLLNLLSSENQYLYIDAISFPFEVASNAGGQPLPIFDETGFQNILDNCGVADFNDYIMNGTCYDFIFPFTVINHSHQTAVMNNHNHLMSMITQSNGSYILDLVYPFTVSKNNQSVVIQNIYQFMEYNDDCSDPCNCPPVDDPVCVQTSSGILQFQNECIANCAGFTTADFVNCD